MRQRIRQKDTPTEIPIVKPEANDKIGGCAIFVVARRCLSCMLSITNWKVFLVCLQRIIKGRRVSFEGFDVFLSIGMYIRVTFDDGFT